MWEMENRGQREEPLPSVPKVGRLQEVFWELEGVQHKGADAVGRSLTVGRERMGLQGMWAKTYSSSPAVESCDLT